LKILIHLLGIVGLITFISLPIQAQMEDMPGIHQLDLERFRDFPSYPDDQIQNIPLEKPAGEKSLTHEVFGYLPYWMYNSYSILKYDLLTTIAYFSAEVKSDGSIGNVHNWPASNLIATAHSKGVKVVLCATLFDKTALGTLLSNQTYRTNLVNNLLSKVRQAGGDGVNIDFEGVPAAQRDHLVIFMRQLADSFRIYISDAQISMATPAVDWSNAWNFNSLAGICDILFIMGYDYYYSGSTTSGPNAPLTGGNYNVTKTVNTYLTSAGSNQSGKIVLGVPYFGFEWPTETNLANSTTTGKGVSIFFDGAETDAAQFGKNWHSSSQTPWYCYYDSHWYQGWYDDSLSLALKYDFAKSKNLGGVGIWALGYDGNRTQLWNALATAFQPVSIEPQNKVNSIFRILPNYPNPANPGTVIPIILDDNFIGKKITISIYDLTGKTILNRPLTVNTNRYDFFWNGLSDTGQPLPSGVYFIKVICGAEILSNKFSLLK